MTRSVLFIHSHTAHTLHQRGVGAELQTIQLAFGSVTRMLQQQQQQQQQQQLGCRAV